MKLTLTLFTSFLLAPLAALQAADSTPLREGRPVHRNLDRFKVLFNHDGTCVFASDSSYQSTKQPVGLKQVQGYVDEVADAQCSALLLSPVWGQTIPLWDSDVVPLWKGVGRTMTCPDTFQGKVIARIRDLLLSGVDFVGETGRRCKERKLPFLLSWRMFDMHGIERPEDPWTNDFYVRNPQFRIGDPEVPFWNSKIALDFSHPEVRAYQLSIIRELFERYDFEGIELDFLRSPYFFSRRIPYERRVQSLRAFLQGVREIVDRRGKDRPIGARVPQTWDLVLELGLDLSAFAREGLLDWVNVSPFYETSSELEIARYRAKLPGTRIFGELTQTTGVVKALELGLETTRKSTPETLRSTAQTFLAQGADGVSMFNFCYYRDYSFGTSNQHDRTEPPFAALHGITDAARLAVEPHHYVLARQNWFHQGQLPLRLDSAGSRHLQASLAVGQDYTRSENRAPYDDPAVLRLLLEKPATGVAVLARLQGRILKPCHVQGELFPLLYKDGVPPDHTRYLDYEVPLALLEKGENRFTLNVLQGKDVVIERLEVAVYRRGAGRGVKIHDGADAATSPKEPK
jgi:hypothetical protein